MEKITVHCTSENAADFRRVVKASAALSEMVKGLIAEGLMPGIRNMSITVEGPPELLAKGVDAWTEIEQQSLANKPQPPKP